MACRKNPGDTERLQNLSVSDLESCSLAHDVVYGLPDDVLLYGSRLMSRQQPRLSLTRPLA